MTERISFIVILLLVSLTTTAQHYTFYGRGAGKSYHKGQAGVYVGYHPDGVGHSRQVIFGSMASRRTGSSLPLHNAAKQNSTSATPAIKGSYNHTNVKPLSHRASTRTTPNTPTNFDLGLSTELNDFRATHTSTASGSLLTSSPVIYGRTGMSLRDGSSNSLSFGDGSSNSFPASLPQLATTTQSQDSENPTVSTQGFLEPSSYTIPLGDPILPLLLLLALSLLLKSITRDSQSSGTAPH